MDRAAHEWTLREEERMREEREEQWASRVRGRTLHTRLCQTLSVKGVWIVTYRFIIVVHIA